LTFRYENVKIVKIGIVRENPQDAYLSFYLWADNIMYIPAIL